MDGEHPSLPDASKLVDRQSVFFFLQSQVNVSLIPELQENTEALKTKMSELRLYCDLLLQQVNNIKENDELGGDAAEVRLRFWMS